MKISKLFLIILLFVSFNNSFSQKAYKIDDFVNYQKIHKTVAVVPIALNLDPKNMPRDLIADDLDKLHESESMMLHHRRAVVSLTPLFLIILFCYFNLILQLTRPNILHATAPLTNLNETEPEVEVEGPTYEKCALHFYNETF